MCIRDSLRGKLRQQRSAAQVDLERDGRLTGTVRPAGGERQPVSYTHLDVYKRQAEELPLGACLYETAPAAGTVGLTLGLTPQLGVLSQSILILLMYFGRVGGLTLIYAAFSGHDLTYARYPQEKITVG